MTRKFTLAVILLLAVTMATVTVANARRGPHALRGMAADMSTTLTEEQRAAIQEKTTEMREAGASRKEIRETVAEMLGEYGIEVPDAWFNRLGKGNHLCPDLTDEQRAAIREKVAEMKETGASREEIREAVAEILKEYGVELPDRQSSRRKSKRGNRDGRRGAYNGANRCINPLAMADLAMIDAQIAAAPQVASMKTSKITSWGKLKAAQ